MNTTLIGQKYEKLALYHLKKQKYKILTTNFLCPAGEIDVIAYDKSTKYIVFVEVKYRSSGKFGRPIEAVTDEKIRKIRIASQVYLKFKGWQEKPFRYDIIEIFDEDVRHIVNAF